MYFGYIFWKILSKKHILKILAKFLATDAKVVAGNLGIYSTQT
jgi:hypothetical protein